MTEFKRVQAEVDELGARLAALEADCSDAAPDTAKVLQEIKATVEGELQGKMAKFEKRLTETDPISGQLRYGEGMRAKVAQLQQQYDALAAELRLAEGKLAAALAAHANAAAARAGEAVSAQQAAAAAAEAQRQAAAARERAAAQAAATRAEAEERERQRLAREAAVLRDKKKADEAAAAAAAEAARLAREREAAAIMASVPVGAAGVEAGLRALRDACGGGGGSAQMRKTCGALLQILQNMRSSPEDPRFRRIRCENERFAADVGRFEGAVQVLLSSGFKVVVEEGASLLVMAEPDLATDMDGWTTWYDTLKDTIDRLNDETNARDRASHGGLMG
ncbi:hypothetical protein JKP88DRAFT_322611 [Tribonema minus]|uniref:PUB domain-containing protein n=1 Tax=Tribonema minus TaxID=303371 RepID=A0A835YSV6_9STRA|nr:hypothetical protein JKP88DRAFT_322611 [Tribonema minus]